MRKPYLTLVQQMRKNMASPCKVEGCPNRAFYDNEKCTRHYLKNTGISKSVKYRTNVRYAEDLDELKEIK